MSIAIAIISLLVATASALIASRSVLHAKRSADAAEGSVREARRSADAAEISAAEARRTADAEEGTLAVERERLARERRAWDAEEAPKWEARGVLSTEAGGFQMVLTNAGPDATIESVLASHALGQSVGLLRHTVDVEEHGSIDVAANDSVFLRFPDPQAYEVARGNHRIEVTVTAVSSMRGVRTKLTLTLLGMGSDHTGDTNWKPNTWRPVP